MGLINHKSKDIKLLKFIYRYIDDLIVLNDNGYFNSIIEKIYPRQLELNATDSSTQLSTCLDSQLVRIFNVNNNVSDFVDCVKTLMKKLHHQNFNRNNI